MQFCTVCVGLIMVISAQSTRSSSGPCDGSTPCKDGEMRGDPANCQWYYLCDHGEYKRMACGDTCFDIDTNGCIHCVDANCQGPCPTTDTTSEHGHSGRTDYLPSESTSTTDALELDSSSRTYSTRGDYPASTSTADASELDYSSRTYSTRGDYPASTLTPDISTDGNNTTDIDDTGQGDGTVVAIVSVLCVLLVICIIAVSIIIYLRRRRKRTDNEAQNNGNQRRSNCNAYGISPTDLNTIENKAPLEQTDNRDSFKQHTYYNIIPADLPNDNQHTEELTENGTCFSNNNDDGILCGKPKYSKQGNVSSGNVDGYNYEGQIYAELDDESFKSASNSPRGITANEKLKVPLASETVDTCDGNIMIYRNLSELYAKPNKAPKNQLSDLYAKPNKTPRKSELLDAVQKSETNVMNTSQINRSSQNMDDSHIDDILYSTVVNDVADVDYATIGEDDVDGMAGEDRVSTLSDIAIVNVENDIYNT